MWLTSPSPLQRITLTNYHITSASKLPLQGAYQESTLPPQLLETQTQLLFSLHPSYTHLTDILTYEENIQHLKWIIEELPGNKSVFSNSFSEKSGVFFVFLLCLTTYHGLIFYHLSQVLGYSISLSAWSLDLGMGSLNPFLQAHSLIIAPYRLMYLFLVNKTIFQIMILKITMPFPYYFLLSLKSDMSQTTP